jgi:uncharacterized membrane protein
VNPPHHRIVHVPDHDVRRLAVLESLRGGLWFIPLMIVLAAAVVASLLVWLDEQVSGAPLAFEGDASSAQGLLTTIAASTLTMTTLVVSITILALQLASQQFSPRVMRTFFRDTGTKVSLGIFLSTTVYALMVLRVVEPATETEPEYLPTFSVTVAFGLMLASLVTFLYFLNHVAHSIRAVHIMEAVAAETRRAIRDQHRAGEPLRPGEWPERPADLIVNSEQPPGVLLGVDEDDLVALGDARGACFRLLPKIGMYVPSNMPLLEVWFDDDVPADATVRAADVVGFVGIGPERTMRQDVGFGFRQLVDMAEKALSPAINDPTTAAQCLNRIHDLLRRLAVLADPISVHRGRTGRPRLYVEEHGWQEWVHLAFDEIRIYGADSLQVHRKLRLILADLSSVVADDPERLAPLLEQSNLLDRAAERAFPDPEDRARAGLATGQS